MQSKAVRFDLSFPASSPTRRQLQTSTAATTDPASLTFQAELKAAVAAALAADIGADQILVAATSDARVLTVTVASFGSASAVAVVATASADAFLSEIASRLGNVSVEMQTPPALILRTTP